VHNAQTYFHRAELAAGLREYSLSGLTVSLPSRAVKDRERSRSVAIVFAASVGGREREHAALKWTVARSNIYGSAASLLWRSK